MLPLTGNSPVSSSAATASPDTTQEYKEAKCMYCLELCQLVFWIGQRAALAALPLAPL